METGEYEVRSTNSKEWAYLTEGAAHMIWRNTNLSEENKFQDKLLVIEKADTGNYLAENVKLNTVFTELHNKHFLKDERFSKFITKVRKVEIEGEAEGEFCDNMMKIAEGHRREDRVGTYVKEGSSIHMEKNLFYVSPHLRKELEVKKALVFFVEIKPKYCLDETPTMEEIKEHLDSHPKGKDVDCETFYNRFFKDCPPSQRKFIYRKMVNLKNKKLLSGFNTADFYSENSFTRVKAIKALLKEDWGYIHLFDENVNKIKHEDFLSFFQKWDPKCSLKTVAEIIAHSLDFELIKMVKELQTLFPFHPDNLVEARTHLEREENEATWKGIEEVMMALSDVWKKGEAINFETIQKLEKVEGFGNYVPLAAFLLSLTSRDSSFLLRVGCSKNGPDFHVVEEWEQGKVKVIENHVDVTYEEHEKRGDNDQCFDDSKFERGYCVQKGKAGEHDHYDIKSKNNLVDVALKPWNKLFEVVGKEKKINKGFVHYFLDELAVKESLVNILGSLK